MGIRPKGNEIVVVAKVRFHFTIADWRYGLCVRVVSFALLLLQILLLVRERMWSQIPFVTPSSSSCSVCNVFLFSEFPKPLLGDPKDLRSLKMQASQEDPLTMTQTLAKLLGRDTIQIEIIPEKKGLFLKHVEYQVTSQVRASAIYLFYMDEIFCTEQPNMTTVSNGLAVGNFFLFCSCTKIPRVYSKKMFLWKVCQRVRSENSIATRLYSLQNKATGLFC